MVNKLLDEPYWDDFENDLNLIISSHPQFPKSFTFIGVVNIPIDYYQKMAMTQLVKSLVSGFFTYSPPATIEDVTLLTKDLIPLITASFVKEQILEQLADRMDESYDPNLDKEMNVKRLWDLVKVG